VSYRLEASQAVKQRVRQLSDLALTQRQARRFSSAFTELVRSLIETPSSIGEPLRDLLTLKLVEYHASVDAIHVRYAVDETNRVVYLQSLRFMPDSGLRESH
jgi:hypothetical protein